MTPERRAYAEKRIERLEAELLTLQEFLRSIGGRPVTAAEHVQGQLALKACRSKRTAIKRWRKELAS